MPVDRRIGPVAPNAMASSVVMTPTPCSRSRQIGWFVSNVSNSSSRPFSGSSTAQRVDRATHRAGRPPRRRDG